MLIEIVFVAFVLDAVIIVGTVGVGVLMGIWLVVNMCA